jgi:hypothetical protein
MRPQGEDLGSGLQIADCGLERRNRRVAEMRRDAATVPNGGNGEEGVNHGLRGLRGTGKAWEFLAGTIQLGRK